MLFCKKNPQDSPFKPDIAPGSTAKVIIILSEKADTEQIGIFSFISYHLVPEERKQHLGRGGFETEYLLLLYLFYSITACLELMLMKQSYKLNWICSDAEIRN